MQNLSMSKVCLQYKQQNISTDSNTHIK